MKSNSSTFGGLRMIGAFLVIGAMTAGCGGGATPDTTGQDAAATSTDGSGPADATAGGAGSTGDAGGDATPMTGTDGRSGGVEAAKVPATPAEERSQTVNDLNGMRAMLMAELDAVRGRLKHRDRSADETKADQTRAGELAQGLESLDRLIKKTTDADDVTWAQVRESSLKEADEFKVWMAKYGMDVAS